MANWVADFMTGRDPGKIVRRHRCALHLDGGDGMTVAYVTGQPMHYEQSPGLWLPIDTTLQAVAGGYAAPHLGVVLATDGTVTIPAGGYGHITRRVGLLNPVTRVFTAVRTLPTASVSGDSLVRSVGAFQQVIRLTEGGVHEELTLAGAPAGDSASWFVIESELTGLSLPDGWVDNAFVQSGFTFPLPVAQDATGAVLQCRRYARTVAGRQMLYTGVPVSVLASAAHPVVIDPDFTADSTWGYIQGSNGVFATARSTGSSLSSTGNSLGVGDNTGYTVWRALVRFDTSSIGSSATVTSTTMSLVATADLSTTDFDVQIVKDDWSSYIPLGSNIDAAFDSVLNGTTDNNIWRNTNGMSTSTTYTSGALDATWVSKTGYTYYGIMSSRDKNNNTPTTAEWIFIASPSHTTTGFRPYITVVYSVSGPEMLYLPYNRPIMHQLMAF